MAEVKRKKDSGPNLYILVPGFIITSILGVVFGPAGKQIHRIWFDDRDTRIITDEQLAITVNMLGAVILGNCLFKASCFAIYWAITSAFMIGCFRKILEKRMEECIAIAGREVGYPELSTSKGFFELGFGEIENRIFEAGMIAEVSSGPKRVRLTQMPVVDARMPGFCDDEVLENMFDNEFKAFLRYDFSADPSFETGLKTIKEKLVGKPESEVEVAIEKAKWFYYSRFVKPFDYQEYMAWKLRTSGSALSSESATEQSAAIAMSQPSIQDLENPKSETTSLTTDSQPNYPKTFAEICALVAQGKPIPGIRQIPNTLHDVEKQSQSILKPRKKPWEEAEQ
ncbi:hypothetical protein BC829DRAFT_421710 [Chytridium lagenaria]|nr:hypothetical protein BC829DRAFT_421710 [Chytridium lagenaria]